MHIHFVCRGNTYRSRLADAYCNSIKKAGIYATSSGTHALDNENGPISWVTAFLLRKYNLINTLSSPNWKQSDMDLFASADILVFMEPENMREALRLFDFAIEKSVAFDIKDINECDITTSDGVLSVINKAENTYEEIKKEVDRLLDTF